MALSPDELISRFLVEAVPIDLDRPRKLICDFEALALVEEQLGIEALDGEAIDALFKSKSVRQQRVLLWALLRRDDPELTLEGAGRLVGYATFGKVRLAIMAAFVAGLPDRDEDLEAIAPGEAPPLAATTG